MLGGNMSTAISESTDTNIEEIFDQNLECNVPGCESQAVAITSHGPSPAEIICNCLVCHGHYMKDRRMVRLAQILRMNGDCNHCGMKDIHPDNVYFREL